MKATSTMFDKSNTIHPIGLLSTSIKFQIPKALI